MTDTIRIVTSHELFYCEDCEEALSNGMYEVSKRIRLQGEIYLKHFNVIEITLSIMF
jgi:hypothetical protein